MTHAHRPKRSKSPPPRARPPAGSGTPPTLTRPAGPAAARDRHCALAHSPDFLEFAQAAGGFGVFDLNLATGGISGTPLFFELIGLPGRDLTLTREEWVATIHPEDSRSRGAGAWAPPSTPAPSTNPNTAPCC